MANFAESKCQEPKVTLLTWTKHPLETVYSVWEASKTTGSLRTPTEIRLDVYPDEVEKLFRAVIAQKIPIGEHVDFVFMMENVSVSWREQAVRHRIGTEPSPERVGVDFVMDEMPNLAKSSWWSQSMRIQDMGRFADERQYRLPPTIAHHADKGLEARYHRTMSAIQTLYRELVEAGIPMEDARELIPLGAHHRISWKLNIGALQHIVGKRGCWILQLGLWGPVIQGMIRELVERVHPVFAELVTPPCLNGDDFTGCVYREECRRRLTGDDALPPCPLHLHHHGLDERGPIPLDEYCVPREKEMTARAEQYRTFWQRDPYTGRRLKR